MVKTNKLKQKKVINEDMIKVRNLIILLVIVILVCVGLYFFTDKMINKDNTENTTKEEVKINYDIATVGTMFNRIEDEYYVIIYSNKDNGSDLDSVVSKYRSSDNYIKTYYVDLDLKINSSAKDDISVKNPKNSNEVKVSEPTLYKIKNGVATNTYIGVDNISKVLK